MLSFVLICLLSSCKIVMFSEVDSGLDSNPFLEAIDLSKSGHVINEHKKAWNAGRRRDVALFGHFENVFKAFIEEGDYHFMIDLGNFTDEKALSEADAVRFYRETANLTNVNHEHHEESSSFDRFFLIFRIGRCTKFSA